MRRFHCVSIILEGVWTPNSVVPGRSRNNFKNVILDVILLIVIFTSSYENTDGWSNSVEIALRLMPQDLTHDRSTLVQVMARCHLAPSHYLSQCWPRSLARYGITRPQCINHCLELGHVRSWNNGKHSIHVFCSIYLMCKSSLMHILYPSSESWLVRHMTSWLTSPKVWRTRASLPCAVCSVSGEWMWRTSWRSWNSKLNAVVFHVFQRVLRRISVGC